MSDRDDGDDQDLGETTERDSVTELQAKGSKWVITVLSCGASKSYVYLPWVHHIQEQWMDVDEFIDQVPKPLKTRNLGKDDQVDFILSPLRGSTLEDICLCTKGEILSFLREAQYSTAVGYLS